MSLKKSTGNMYPWVTHMHTHLRGKCPHACSYCYAQSHERRWGSGAFAGDIRVREEEFSVKYGSGKVIFMEHQSDLFADGIPSETISRIIAHCKCWPDNKYVFQTKNPNRMLACIGAMPSNCFFGTTIESNIQHNEMMDAPPPSSRARAMSIIALHHRTFVTIEPIMRFDLSVLTGWIKEMNPEFVNVGADSKGSGLVEPTRDEINALIVAIADLGIEVRGKHNLERLVKK